MLNDFKKSFKLEYEKRESKEVFVPLDITLKGVDIFFEQLYKEVVDKAVSFLDDIANNGCSITFLTFAKDYESVKQVHKYSIGYLFNANTDLVYNEKNNNVLHAIGQDQALAFIEAIEHTLPTNGMPVWFNNEMTDYCVLIIDFLYTQEGLFE